MNAKTLAHDIQKRLSAELDVKRSLVYELIAAAFGAGSYAALCADGLLCRLPAPAARRRPLQPNPVEVDARVRALRFPLDMADQIATDVCDEIRNADMGLVSWDAILDSLLAGQTTLYADDPEPKSEESERWGDDDMDQADEEAWRSRWQEHQDAEVDLDTPEMKLALLVAADRGDGRAHLALALLVGSDMDDDVDFGMDGSYWHSRRESGEVLTGVEKEWADGYEQSIEAKQSAHVHLEKAADLGQHDALLLLADRYGDTRFFGLESPKVKADPCWVADIADRLGRYDLAVHWLEVAAALGNVGAMRDLIEQRQSGDQLKCWTWHHLAMLHGTDLTKDNYHAIHEDGSSYDDDVGGPMFADGRDGVTLPPTSKEVRAQAQRLAAQLFEQAADV